MNRAIQVLNGTWQALGGSPPFPGSISWASFPSLWLGVYQAAFYSVYRLTEVHLQLETVAGQSQYLLPMKLKPLSNTGLVFLGSTAS